MRVAILASGRGSNFQSIIDASKENKLPNNLLFSYTEILNDLTLTKKEF